MVVIFGYDISLYLTTAFGKHKVSATKFKFFHVSKETHTNGMIFENDVSDELQTIFIQIFSMGLPTRDGDAFSNIGATIGN